MACYIYTYIAFANSRKNYPPPDCAHIPCVGSVNVP